MTLRLAEEALDVHAGDVDEQCPVCRTAWPCEAYQRAQRVKMRLTRRDPAIGYAQVHPHWCAGEPTDG